METAPVYAEFSKQEFEERWDRSRAEMDRAGLDALLITGESNYRYLSGHVTQAWLNKARPLFMVLPRVGDPVLVVGGSETSVARNTSYVRDIRFFRTFAEPGVVELTELLRERCGATRTIGCELGTAQRLGMPPADFGALKERLPGFRFVDAADIFWRLRLVKSAAELAYIRRAISITNEAVAKTLTRVRSGWSERQVFQELASGVMLLGADRPGYIPVNADAHAPDSLTGGPTERRLEIGRMVYMGAGCAYHGYWADQVRVFAVGPASDRRRQMYRIIQQALDRSLATIKVGTPVAEIMRATMAEFEGAGVSKYTGRLGRIGHGTGLDLSEPPSINLEDPTILQAGMVLYVEPNFATEDGNFLVEEMVLVTPEGPEMLSMRAAAELPTVA
jgi:Xaa-Pro dipeptidase